MSLSTLPLSYCTNVHPGRTVEEVLAGLRQYTIPTRRDLAKRIAAGLWFAASVAEELSLDANAVKQLKALLEEGDLACYTLNTFPFGDFHGERVKENVYLPDWTSPQRLDYTLKCAQLLSKLMPAGVEGSLSTVPLGFKGFPAGNEFIPGCIEQLLALAQALDQLHDETGQVIRLAIEPEPCCILETTAETVEFFSRLFSVAESRQQLDVARRHLGVCYDVCHQAVEFEDVAASIRALDAAQIRINKVHITCALHLDQPAENLQARRELARFAEPRYLHQTFARTAGSKVSHQTDLTEKFCLDPPEEFASAQAWRIHFHVPVHCERIGSLATTRIELHTALLEIHRLQYAPHLEVETYTWGVLPGEQPHSLAQGLAQELTATRLLMKQIQHPAQTAETD